MSGQMSCRTILKNWSGLIPLQSGDLLFHSRANNGKLEIERQYIEGKQYQPLGNIICSVHTIYYKLVIVQVYAPTTSYREEDINSYYNDVDEAL